MVRGEPILTGGIIKFKKLLNNTQRISLRNHSGHYKPSSDSLNQVLQYLRDQGLKFRVTIDVNKIQSNDKRYLRLQTEKYICENGSH